MIDVVIGIHSRCPAACAVVTVNGVVVDGAGRMLDYFHRAIPVDNASAPQYPDITVRATTSPGVSEAGGHAFWARRAVPSTRVRREVGERAVNPSPQEPAFLMQRLRCLRQYRCAFRRSRGHGR